MRAAPRRLHDMPLFLLKAVPHALYLSAMVGAVFFALVAVLVPDEIWKSILLFLISGAWFGVMGGLGVLVESARRREASLAIIAAGARSVGRPASPAPTAP